MQFNFYYRATATSHCSGLHFDPLSFTAALQVFGSAALFMHSSLSSGLWTVTEPSFVSFAAVLGVIVLFMTQFGPSFGRGFMETQWLQGDETLIAPSPCQQVIQRVCPDMTCLILPTHAAHDEQTSPICSRSLQRLCKPDPCCRVPFGEMLSLPNKPHLFSRLLIVLSWTLTFNRWPEAREVWALHCANTPESFRTAKCPNVYTYTGAHSCWGAVSLIPLEFPHDSKNQPVTDVTRQELHVFTITSYYVLVQRARSLCEYDVALTRYSFRTRWTHVFEVAEGDELNDVPEDGLSFGWAQDPVVAVQHLHVAEVGVPDTNDDDGHGEVGSLNDGLPRVGHVGDDAVCQDQQDEVLLEDWTWRDPVRPAPAARTISLNPAGFKRSSGSISNYIHIYVCVCGSSTFLCSVA